MRQSVNHASVFVQGHALAGGCVMALSCDYRVMASDSSIAMVETMAVG